MSDLAPNGNVTRFTQFGTFSVVTCCAIGCLSAAIAWATPQAIVELGFGSAICFGVAILLSRLTIEVSDTGVRWYFTGGLFGATLDFDEIASVTTQTVVPLGFGYRVGYKKTAWLVSGRSVVVFSRAGSDIQYLVGTDNPEGIREEIERRLRHAGTTAVALPAFKERTAPWVGVLRGLGQRPTKAERDEAIGESRGPIDQ